MFPIPAACDKPDDLALGPAARWLAVGCFDGNTFVWDLTSTSLPVPLGTPASCAQVVHVAFSPTGHVLAISCLAGTVELWDAASHRPLLTLPGGGQAIAFSPRGETLAAGDATGEVRLWDVATGAALGEPLPNGSGPVSAVGFTPDGRTLVTYDDGAVRVWSGILAPDATSVRDLACGFVWGDLSQSEWRALTRGGLGYPAGSGC
jgi:WD40 repeat protein